MQCVWLAYEKRIVYTLAYADKFLTCPKKIFLSLRITQRSLTCQMYTLRILVFASVSEPILQNVACIR